VDEINGIDEQKSSWLPNACSELNSELVFESNNEETRFSLEKREHYFFHEELLLSCNGNYEHGTYVEQKNEVIELAYLDILFGSDTVYIKLNSIINSYENQTPNPKVDIISLLHRRSFSNIANFYFRHRIGDTDFDHNSRTFHNSIVLSGEEYASVVEFKLRTYFHADPHTRLYIIGEFGILDSKKMEERG